MSSIDTYLEQIKQAVYGKDVRDAIYNSIKECYDDTSTSTTKADSAATRATTAAEAAYAAAGMEVGIAPYTAFDILAGCSKVTRTVNGITFEWSGNKLTVDGTFSSGATSALSSAFSSQTSFPFGMKPGMTYRLLNETTPVWVYYSTYDGSAWSNSKYIRLSTNVLTIPPDATGIRFGVGVSDIYESSSGYGHAECYPVLLSSDVFTNDELASRIEQTFPLHGALPASDTAYNLDDLTTEGMYCLPAGRTYDNRPSDVTFSGAGFLFVYPLLRSYGVEYTGTVLQKLTYPRLGDWVRVRSDGVWGAWRRATMPDRPARDGVYELRCTVSDGNATYNWVSI